MLPNGDARQEPTLPAEADNALNGKASSQALETGAAPEVSSISLKRKAEEDDTESLTSAISKKPKVEITKDCYYDTLPQATPGTVSLFLKEDFRDHFCRCAKCYLDLRKHPQLLEEEESYEPPLSEDDEEGQASLGTGSLLDRGEAALNNVDRVRAIGKFLIR